MKRSRPRPRRSGHWTPIPDFGTLSSIGAHMPVVADLEKLLRMPARPPHHGGRRVAHGHGVDPRSPACMDGDGGIGEMNEKRRRPRCGWPYARACGSISRLESESSASATHGRLRLIPFARGTTVLPRGVARFSNSSRAPACRRSWPRRRNEPRIPPSRSRGRPSRPRLRSVAHTAAVAPQPPSATLVHHERVDERVMARTGWAAMIGMDGRREVDVHAECRRVAREVHRDARPP